MFRLLALLFCLTPLQVLAQACIIEAESAHTKVRLCQKNRSIPPQLFAKGFCQPKLAGQTTQVSFAEQCPSGAFGVCRNARSGGMPYQQDIYYYGVASDARFLKETLNKTATFSVSA